MSTIFESASGLTIIVLLILLPGLLIEVLHQKNRPGKKSLLVSYRTNLTLFLLNHLVLSALSLTAVYAIVENHRELGLIHGFDYSLAGGLIALIFLDFFLYLWHRANHSIPLLWMFHKVHHSDRSMNITTALRFHPGELILTTFFKALLILLLGIPLEVLLATEAIIACFTLFHHLNLPFPGQSILKWILIVPDLHRLHHSTRRSEHDSNFGSVFSIWDRSFRTLREIVPDSIGLPGIPGLNAWQAWGYGFSKNTLESLGPAPACAELHSGMSIPSGMLEGVPEKRPQGYVHDSGPAGSVPIRSNSSAAKHAEELERLCWYLLAPGRIWYAQGTVPENRLFAWSLAGAGLIHEITECCWQLNSAYLSAYAKVSFMESAGQGRKRFVSRVAPGE
ncbi:MAG: sterol desaturase family protein [Gammaproteobacteria bacterium]